MTKRNRDLARRGTGGVTSGSGQVTGSAGPVTLARRGIVFHRVVPAQLACRIGARARAGERDAWLAVVSIALGSFAASRAAQDTLKLPFAAYRPLPGRNCHAQRGCDDRVRTA